MNVSKSATASRKILQVMANGRVRPARSRSAWYANAAKPDQTASLYPPADRYALNVLILLKPRRRRQLSCATISSRHLVAHKLAGPSRSDVLLTTRSRPSRITRLRHRAGAQYH